MNNLRLPISLDDVLRGKAGFEFGHFGHEISSAEKIIGVKNNWCQVLNNEQRNN
jgi:hypothetical protein